MNPFEFEVNDAILVQAKMANKIIRAYFSKAKHECDVNEKRNISLNLGQFQDETP